jgi:hypothetical protein
MAFTDHCDLFGAVHEDGLNLIARHVMRKRPSLFNYGTQAVANNPALLCAPINAAPEVSEKGNPLLTVEDPLPVLGTNGLLGLNFCAQLVAARIDLHPGGIFELPPELSPPLAEQRLAVHARVCAGIGCPPDEILDNFTPSPGTAPSGAPILQLPPAVIPTRSLECFCLQLFAVAHLETAGATGNQFVAGRLDGLEIVDVRPVALESSLECYLRLLIRLVILPRLSVALGKLVLEVGKLATVTLSATATSAALPNNPAIEGDQLEVCIDMEVKP